MGAHFWSQSNLLRLGQVYLQGEVNSASLVLTSTLYYSISLFCTAALFYSNLWSNYCTKGAFIVCCNTAALPMYQLLIYSSSTQHTTPQVHFLAVPQCSSRRRDWSTTTATYRTAAAVDYERTFSPLFLKHSHQLKLKLLYTVTPVSLHLSKMWTSIYIRQ